MSSYKLVRAQHPDGGSSTMTEARAVSLGLKFTEEGALDHNGRPLPGTPPPSATTETSAARFSAAMKRDELDAAAAALGLDSASFATKDELADALNAAASGQEG